MNPINYLTREDFEQACTKAGITDLTRSEDGYQAAHTQATYQVWLSVTGQVNAGQHKPLGWVSRRNGRFVHFSLERPRSPGQDGWERRAAQGWDFPLPVFPHVPGITSSAYSVIMERTRQQVGEGYGPEWDACYERGELEHAGACYALQGGGAYPLGFARYWPFNTPIKRCARRESLIKAGALILAALEADANRLPTDEVQP